MSAMSPAEIREFLMADTRTAKVATVRADGRPHVAPVWFVLDGDDLIFNTGAATLKGKALRRDPRVAICVEDDRRPFAFVVITGEATLSTDPEELVRTATAIGARYMGADRADEFGRRNGVPGELVVRVTPTSVAAEKGLTD
jgi:PPOX class probable F420-dependent enzyme